MRRLRVTAAVLGAACLLLLSIPSAGAADALPVYDSFASGQGIVATAGIRPSILESAGQAGVLYGDVSTSSQGGGFTQSFAAPIFPGKTATGALTGPVGCGGIKGWVEARWPATDNCSTRQEDAFVRVGLEQTPTSGAEMLVTAGLASGTTDLSSAKTIIRPSANEPPILRVGAMTVDIDAGRIGSALQHVSTVTAKEVRLLNDAVTIGTIVSRAVTLSDGESAHAQAEMTFSDVSVTVNGTSYRATIDNDGITVTDPSVSRRVAAGLNETIEDDLLQAGIRISATSPIEITDGGEAEASVGGLVIVLSARIPSVPVPDEAAPVIGTVFDSIPTKCLSDIHQDRPDALAPITDQIPSVPLCFGAGALPGGGSEPVMTLTVAAATSRTVGARLGGFDPGPDIAPDVPPNCFCGVDVNDPLPPGLDTPPIPPGTDAQQPVPPVMQAPTGPLVGLIARLPDAALAISGALLTILAFALSAWPSLRHAGAR